MNGSHQKHDGRTWRVYRTQLAPLLSGAALGIATAGAALAFADFSSPLRAPLAFFFLLLAPAAAIAGGLEALDPVSRTVLALIGSVVLNTLVAQLLLALGSWSAQTAVAIVAMLSVLALAARLMSPTHPHQPNRAEGPAP